MTTRRNVLGCYFAAVGGRLLGATLNSRVGGVLIGVQSYSFRDRDLDACIQGIVEVGLSECELWQGHVEPRVSGSTTRDDLRRWRVSVPLDSFQKIREKFDSAGITLSAYNYSFRDDFTDEEIERGFLMAKALGAPAITASSTVSVTKRVAPFAATHKMRVGMHGHDNLADPNEFARPESFIKAMNESPWICVNLDIGHFTAAGYDPIEFLQKYHERVVTLHIKDRKKSQGPNMPFGQGDTPTAEVLRVLKRNRWDIPANIEYAYKGGDTVQEIARCYEFCRRALSS